MKHCCRSLLRLWVLLILVPSLLTIYAQENEPPPGLTIHVVQRGETLFRIAQHYGLTVDELAHLNSLLDPNSIQVGQRLLVPAQATAIGETHTVQPGETLRTIAELYGVTIDELARWNDIANIDSIYAGQVIVVALGDATSEIPSAAETDDPTQSPTDLPTGIPTSTPTDFPATTVASAEDVAGEVVYSTVIHTVARGETLFRVAQQYGVTVNAILRANQITNPDTIYVGQQLAIPGVGEPQLATTLPAPLTGLEITPLILTEGQTGRIRITTSTPATVTGSFLQRSLNIADEEDGLRKTALVGIPVGTTAGIHALALTVTGADGVPVDVAINVQIISGGYGRESIRLLSGREDLLDEATEDAEMAILANVMSGFTTERYFDAPMGLPAAAPMSSRFGNTRSYNGGAFERIHAGTDFAGGPGTPILAPASGWVVLADDLNVRGTATVIDHGWGVYTGYWHQSARYVSVGDYVSTGQVIGAIGSSGRVTGAHLHWELWVSGVPVDPMQWVSVNFS